MIILEGLQEEQHEHGQGKMEGKQKGKTDKRVSESKARQNHALHDKFVIILGPQLKIQIHWPAINTSNQYLFWTRGAKKREINN
jgi:hypothetical protein